MEEANKVKEEALQVVRDEVIERAKIEFTNKVRNAVLQVRMASQDLAIAQKRLAELKFVEPDTDVF